MPPPARGPALLLTALLTALLTVGLVGALPPLPASAHEADPRLVTTLTEVVPALPEAVVVQVQPGIAAQVVADNPTTVPLEVLGERGRAFLRLSAAGVFADVAAREFFTTSNPTGAAPPAAADGAARWVRISAGTSWGWYDHRLHPRALPAPQDEQREARLADFAVPLRYGDQRVQARGSVRFVPLLGSILATADDGPPGLQVEALPGRLPGLFLSVEPGADVLVTGRDGEPFLRFTSAGVEVNTASRTHVEDRAARGEPVGAPSLEPAFSLVDPGGRSWTWLDARLRYPADLPPVQVLRAAGPTRLQSWEVPVLVGGAPAVLRGALTWVPEADAAERGGAAAGAAPTSSLPYVLGGSLLALGGTALVLRNRRRAQRPR